MTKQFLQTKSKQEIYEMWAERFCGRIYDPNGYKEMRKAWMIEDILADEYAYRMKMANK